MVSAQLKITKEFHFHVFLGSGERQFLKYVYTVLDRIRKIRDCQVPNDN